jgi:hypothetical protein
MPDAATADILIRARADATEIERMRTQIFSVFEQIKAGLNFDIGSQIAQGLRSIPQMMDSVVDKGIQFNATLETSKLGIAAVLKQFDQTGKFQDFDAALEEAAGAIEMLKQAAKESPATFESLVQAYQGTAGAMASSGMNIQQQVNTIVTMSQTLAGLGIRNEQILQETRAILMGNINEDAQAARILEITRKQVEDAKQQGTLFEFIQGRMDSFAEAGRRGAQSYTVSLSNIEDAFTQTAASLTADLFEKQKASYMDLQETMNSDQFKRGLKDLLQTWMDFRQAVLEGKVWLAQHADYVNAAARAARAAALAYAGWKIGQWAGALANWTLGIVKKTMAVRAETAAVQANSAAWAANTAARAPGALAPGAAGRAGGGMSGAAALGLAAISSYELGNEIGSQMDRGTEAVGEIGEHINQANQQINGLLRNVSSDEGRGQVLARINGEIELMQSNLKALDSLPWWNKWQIPDGTREGWEAQVRTLETYRKALANISQEEMERRRNAMAATAEEQAAEAAERRREANALENAETLTKYEEEKRRAARNAELKDVIESGDAARVDEALDRRRGELAGNKLDRGAKPEELAAHIEWIKLLEREAELLEAATKKIDEDKKKKEEADAEDAKQKQEAQEREERAHARRREALEFEVRMAEMRAKGRDEEAQRMERERAILEEINALWMDGAITQREATDLYERRLAAERAMADAERRRNLQDQQPRDERTPGGQKISQDEFTLRTRAQDRAAADVAADTYEGRRITPGDGPLERARAAAEQAGEQVSEATGAASGSTDAVGAAINEMGASMVETLSVITQKQNAIASEIRLLSAQVASLAKAVA